MPPKWLHLYDDFITKNAHQVSQIESTLRSLTYIIPGRFRDAEIASESIHSGVQLLSLYHDTLLRRRAHALSSSSKVPPPPPHASSSSSSSGSLQPPPTPHARYTRHWTLRSALYRRVAYLLQVVQYVQLLCEMGARRRGGGGGEQTRWRAVVVLEALKALCRLLLLRITRSRPVVTPVLPEREPIPEEEGDTDGEGLEEGDGLEEDDEERGAARLAGGADANGSAVGMNGSALQQSNGSISAYSGRAPPQQHKLGPNGEWTMPRTGMKLPTLPLPGDTGGFLQARVLTADDIKPAPRLLNRLRGAQAHAAEVLHILAPLVFALALARTPEKDRRRAWTPWLLGVGVEVAARQLRDQGLRTTPLEREEWSRRGWAMGWWAMRGAFYQHVTKGVVAGVRRRVPGLVAGILEDYEYLWENYYFSTAD